MTVKLKDLLPERMSPPTFKRTDRVHTNSKDLPTDILLRRYGNPRQPRGPKPKGFWYAFGDAWLEYVKYNDEYRAGSYAAYYLADVGGCKLLKMSKYKELVEFTQEFTYDDDNPYYINWNKVKKKYDGIEINPHVSQAAKDEATQWYYGWDVASGCVWRPKKLKLEKVR
jgi:hypothetical protein